MVVSCPLILLDFLRLQDIYCRDFELIHYEKMNRIDELNEFGAIELHFTYAFYLEFPVTTHIPQACI